MPLLDNGNPAAAAGNDNLSGVRQSTDGFYFYNINGLRGGNDSAEAFSGRLLHIVALFHFNLRIVGGHIPPNQLGGLIKSLVVGVHRHLGENRGYGFADAPAKKLRFQGILDIIAHISLTHGAANAHGGGGVVDIKTAQLRHGLVYHTDLRAVAVGDGQLVASLHQIGKGFCGNLDGVPLFGGGIAKGVVSE